MAGRFHRVPRLLLASLRSGPEFLGHDAERRHVPRHPLGRSVQARHAPSSVWILHVPKAIPHEPTDVELVVQNPGPAFGVPVDRARAPWPAEWTGNTFSI